MLLLLFSLFCLSHGKTITLNDDTIVIRGPINSESTNKFFMDIGETQNNITIFINSPGGSVMDGMEIIDHIKMLQDNNVQVNCIADYSASMAFIILQSCTNRYALFSSIIMQHQMSLGSKGNLYNMQNYLNFIGDVDQQLDVLQADKIGMCVNDFRNLIENDWWLTGNTALERNVVDSLVHVRCSKKLYQQSTSIQYNTVFGEIELVFSKCPLVRNHLDINIRNKDNFTNEQIDTIMSQVKNDFQLKINSF